MPNWCSNTLKVEGEIEELANLIKFLNQPYTITYGEKTFTYSKPVFSFRNVIQPPEENLEEYYKNGWYGWNIEHWGTKWDIANADGTSGSDVFCEKDSLPMNYVTYVFDTAWAPPRPVIEALSAKYPTLTFTHSYIEPGMCFWGIDIYSNGVKESEIYEDDISHKAYTLLGNEEGCICNYQEDDEYIYSDCPKSVEKVS